MAMKVRRISDAIAGGCLAGMVAQANRNSELADAVKATLPDWVDFGEITIAAGPDRQVWLNAPPAITRLMRQILPVLKERLRELGYRQIKLGRSRNSHL